MLYKNVIAFHCVHNRPQIKMQTKQDQAAALLSAQLPYHGGLWCHPCISSENRSFKDNKRRLPMWIVNTLWHTLVPQSSAANAELLNLDLSQVGTTAHTALMNGGKAGRLCCGSQNATSQASAACCVTRVGTGWELALWLLSVILWFCAGKKSFVSLPLFSPAA